MKILQIIASVNPENGGPIESVKQMSRILANAGHTTHVATLDGHDEPWVEAFPLTVHALGPGRGGYRYARTLVPWLRRHAQQYDAVVVNGVWQYASFGTWRALHRAKTPYYVYPHGMLDPWFKQAYPLKHLKKTLYWLWSEYRVLRDARAVLFTCEEERVLAQQSFRPYHCREIVVRYGTAMPEGNIQAQGNAFRVAFPHTQGKRLILFLSRLHVKKGCDLLIKAFADVARLDPTLHLVIAGPDNTGLRPELERLAQRLNVADRITWTGMLQGELKWGAYRAADVFALPSHQENFGIVVAEALACGLPVLLSNKVNIWREVEEAGAGLVAPDDEAGTLGLLQRWLSMPGDAQKQMRVRAGCCFQEQFEIGQAARSLVQVLQTHDT